MSIFVFTLYLFISCVYQQWNFVMAHQRVNFCQATVINTAVITVMFNRVFVITLQSFWCVRFGSNVAPKLQWNDP
jgi:hypothetical protein